VAAAIETSGPAIIHVATHVIPSPESGSDSLIALSPGGNGAAALSLVGPEWIAGRQSQARLVVLNGCRSGSGGISAAEGLMGLSRAWLYAGAGAVVSTHWPTIDDSGILLQEFYRHLQSRPIPQALREAQTAMIRAGDWRANPRYWASYFLVAHPE
jgi:CHAT domain-containing protein